MIPSVSLSKRLFKQRRFRQLLLAIFTFAIVLGIAIVPIERNLPGSKIHSYFDGFYWAVTTLTTVGYGDVVPVGTWGRILAIILQLIGTLMYGIVIAMIGSYINRTQEEFLWNRMFEKVDRLEKKIETIGKKSDFIVKENSHDQNLPTD